MCSQICNPNNCLNNFLYYVSSSWSPCSWHPSSTLWFQPFSNALVKSFFYLCKWLPLTKTDCQIWFTILLNSCYKSLTNSHQFYALNFYTFVISSAVSYPCTKYTWFVETNTREFKCFTFSITVNGYTLKTKTHKLIIIGIIIMKIHI